MAGFAAESRGSIKQAGLPVPKGQSAAEPAGAPNAAPVRPTAPIPMPPMSGNGAFARREERGDAASSPSADASPSSALLPNSPSGNMGSNSAPSAKNSEISGILARKDSSVSERDSARFVRTSLKNGRKICIKYPLKQKDRPDYKLFKIAAGFLKQPFMLPVPPMPAPERNLAEIAKLRALKEAFVPVPEILAVQNGFSVFADTEKDIEQVLAELLPRSAELYDKLLIRCGQTLGQAHAAGLCIGQPSLRNMFLAQHGIGFSGFVDYPEQVMAMADAQMRDIWLLLRLLAIRAVNKDVVLRGAFKAWRRPVGLETLESLRSAARFFRMIARPCRICSPLFFSRKQKNMLYVLRFLVANAGI